MKRRLDELVLFMMWLTGLAGCHKATDPAPIPRGTDVLLVVNSLGETLDRIDLATGTVLLGATPLGRAPNAVVVDPARDAFFIANSLDNRVTSVGLSTFDEQNTIDLGPNSSPYSLALLSSGQIAVTNWVAGDVAWLDPETRLVTHRLPIGRGPEALLETGGALFATVIDYDVPNGKYGPGQVVRIEDHAVERRATVGTNPQDVITGPDGRIHVVCTGNYGTIFGKLMILDPATLAVQDSIALGGSPAYAIRSGRNVYVSGFYGGLLEYDGVTHEVLRGLDHPVLDFPGLGDMAIDPVAHRLYVPGFDDDLVYVVDTEADTLVTAWSTGDGPVAVAIATIPE